MPMLGGWRRQTYYDHDPTSLDDIELSNEIDMGDDRDSYAQRSRELDNIIEEESRNGHQRRHQVNEYDPGTIRTYGKLVVAVVVLLPLVLLGGVWTIVTLRNMLAANPDGGEKLSLTAGQQKKGSDSFRAPLHLSSVCAVDRIESDEGFAECDAACRLASCCGEEGPNGKCSEDFPEICSEYKSCAILSSRGHEVVGQQRDVDLESIPDIVTTACSSTINRDEWSQCENVCAPAACCFQDNEYGGCQEEDWCMYYRKCEVLHLDLEGIVADACLKGTDLEKCLEICSPARCCFSTNEGGCGESKWCMEYRKCDVIFNTLEILGNDVVKNVEDACVGEVDWEKCQGACLDGACCFEDPDYGGCDAEMWCDQYNSCAVLYDVGKGEKIGP